MLELSQCTNRLPLNRGRAETQGGPEAGSNFQPVVSRSTRPSQCSSLTCYSEKKIDLIEERLGNIEEALLELKSTLARNRTTAESCHHATPASKQMTPDTSGFASNTTAALEHESGTGFEGNSSLAAHSAYASAFLETVVSRSAPQVSTPKINAALTALRQIVNMQSHPPGSSSKDVPLPNQKDGRVSNLRDLVMPPMQVVLPILRQIKGTFV